MDAELPLLPQNYIHPSVDTSSAAVWHGAVVQRGVVLGEDVSIGSQAEISEGCRIGDRSRISAKVFLPKNTVVEAEVFIGPGVICTDDRYPRAGQDYDPQPPFLKRGCSIGAGAVILPGVTIGEGAMVSAGAIVTKDIPAFTTTIMEVKTKQSPFPYTGELRWTNMKDEWMNMKTEEPDTTPEQSDDLTEPPISIPISVVMIVRNEEDTIQEALRSIGAEVDEVCILDTGSTDNTKEVAFESRKLFMPDVKFRFKHTEWKDDFSACRNQVIESATHDWVVVLDADERLTDGWLTSLRKAIVSNTGVADNAPPPSTLRFECISETNGAARHQMVRAIRKSSGVRYVGRIHEAPSQDSHILAEGCSLRYGYSPSHEGDPHRNLRILRAEETEALQNGVPTSNRTLFYLGVHFLERDQWYPAIRYFTERVKEVGFQAECAQANYFLAIALWEVGRYDAARTACMNAITLNPTQKSAFRFMKDRSHDHDRVGWEKLAEAADDSRSLFPGR